MTRALALGRVESLNHVIVGITGDNSPQWWGETLLFEQNSFIPIQIMIHDALATIDFGTNGTCFTPWSVSDQFKDLLEQ